MMPCSRLICAGALLVATCGAQTWAQPPSAAAEPFGIDMNGGKPTLISPPEQEKPETPPAEASQPGVGEPPPKPPEGPGSKPDPEPAILQRPKEPPEPADPAELEVRPDPEGRVRFSFRGQAWPDVLDWLATVSHMSLDWQHLPGDYLNLITQRSYTLDEARDLINRHLLARGFTMLIRGEVMSVVKLESIDPALVPRVAPDELASLMPHQYVKVSLPLDWMIAQEAVEELKPMLSPHGKLIALKATNRLEAMDAAANLRELHAVLSSEQSPASQDRLIQEFVLHFARADDVRSQLLSLLGIQEKGAAAATPMSPQQMQMAQQQAQMAAQMQQQQGSPGGPGGPSTRPRRAEDEVHLVVNLRRNSILAHAPPDRMAIVAKAVETIDVPPQHEQTLLLNVNRMQVYRLASLDPDVLVKTLQEVGDLDPMTRLEADSKNKAVIAYASLVDHMTIRAVVSRLDGSGRRFEVIRLRRLAADYVAGTIEFMMGHADAPQQDSRPRYMSWYGPSREPEESKDKDRLRVDADVEGNRLLLWASDLELEEVRHLLVKLGEIPSDDGLDRVRVVDLEPGEAADLLDRLRQAWPSLSPNPLLLPDVPEAPEPTPGTPSRGAGAGQTPLDARRGRPSSNTSPLVHFTQLPGQPEAEDERPADPPRFAGPSDPPPIKITLDREGRLVITSQDPQALNLMEDVIAQLAAPRKDYRQFPLRYASAYWVRLNLQDFFDDKEKDDRDSRRRSFYFYDYPPPKQEKRHRLSQRRPLKFIDDLDTNSVLVVGADADQMRAIEDLIRMWDVPPASDSESARLVTHFQIRYSRASVIADAVKDVYRDLLSANDKAMQAAQQQAKRPANQSTYIWGDPGNEEPDRRAQVAFKGKLSIGVDEVSNTLLVSTEGQALMDNITKMIQTLDQAAQPADEVRVLTLRGDVSPEYVRQILSEVLNNSAKTAPAPPARDPGPATNAAVPPAAH